MGVWNVSVPGPSLPPYRVLHKGTTTVFAKSRPSSQLALVFGGRLQEPGDAIVASRGRGRPYPHSLPYGEGNIDFGFDQRTKTRIIKMGQAAKERVAAFLLAIGLWCVLGQSFAR